MSLYKYLDLIRANFQDITFLNSVVTSAPQTVQIPVMSVSCPCKLWSKHCPASIKALLRDGSKRSIAAYSVPQWLLWTRLSTTIPGRKRAVLFRTLV